MSFQPFLDASPVVQVHAIAAIEALILGPFLLYRRRRDRMHRMLGYVWVTNMLIAATTSMFILDLRMIGPFSPIHALSLLTIASLWLAIRAARARKAEAHRRIMMSLYWGGLVISGILAFLPGRIMHRVLFGSDLESVAPLALGGTLVVVAGLAHWHRKRGPVRSRQKTLA